MRTIEATATTPAPPAAVWALLADVRTWTSWGTWTESGVEGGGEQRLGAVRLLTRKPFRLREEITEWVPEERMAYALRDGMPVQGYEAVVTLEPAPGGGTLVRWRSTYERANPLIGLLLRAAVKDTCKRVAAAATTA